MESILYRVSSKDTISQLHKQISALQHNVGCLHLPAPMIDDISAVTLFFFFFRILSKSEPGGWKSLDMQLSLVSANVRANVWLRSVASMTGNDCCFFFQCRDIDFSMFQTQQPTSLHGWLRQVIAFPTGLR